MAEPPAIIVRKAKSLQQGLKDLLKNNDPWDKEVEFQRKDLRKKYLTLLLLHAYARESKDAETHLWMQTSYNFISIYKQRLAALDRAIQVAKQQQQQQQQPGRGEHAPIVEHRKLTQRFRQFLAEEEKFWTHLLVRYRHEFVLEEVQPLLVSLGIVPAIEEPVDDVHQDQAREPSAPHPQGRKNAIFPPEDGPHPPTNASERDGRLIIFSKAMICLGDISRYRELYNDTRGRAGRRGRGGGPEPPQRPRNFDKALQCYEKARILTPDFGNASHQLAILAAYSHDVFKSLVHYYQALCVRHPYETAAGNFGTALSRAFDQWKRSKREREKKHTRQGSNPVLPKIRVDTFKENVVLLHALWRFDPAKIDAEAPGHAEGVVEAFKALIAERILPIDMITKVVILSEGALWKHRMVRDPSSSNKKASTSASSAAIERRIFLHVLSVHRILLEVGLVELSEPPSTDVVENDLAQNISAIFRRTLPALRIAGKWLKANYKYVIRDIASDNNQPNDAEQVQAFWDTYARFFCVLICTFPINSLPPMKMPLEEDIDVMGFLPLRKIMGEVHSHRNSGGSDAASPESHSAEQVHPNVEQLMRIYDLLTDAKAVVAMERCPVALYGNRFVLKGIESVGQPLPAPPPANPDGHVIPHQELMEDIRGGQFVVAQGLKVAEDLTAETSRADDDPVSDAFRQVLSSDQEMDDDDEEQIVWDPRPPLSPVSSQGLPSLPLAQPPMTPVKAPVGPPITPTHRPSISTQLSPFSLQTKTTAQDLFNSFSVSPRPRGSAHLATAPTPQLLFGSGSLSNPGNSIWSATMDDQVMTSAGQNGIMYQSVPQAYHAASLSQNQTSQNQTTWQPSQSMYNLSGSLSPSTSSQPMHSSTSSSHQRVPSVTLPIGHELYSTSPAHGAIGSHNPASSLPNHQRALNSSIRPMDNVYRPIEGALYETPHIPNSPDGSLNVLHSRHLSLADDPRLNTVYRPLPQTWGNIG